MLGLVICGALLLVIVGVVVWAVRSRWRLARAGWVECALRSPSGSAVSGLGVRWRHGFGKATPGTLVFRPGGPGGVAIPVGPPSALTVVTALATDRSPGWRSAWSINPGLSTALLSTPEGRVELAAREPELQRVLRGLDRSSDGELPHLG